MKKLLIVTQAIDTNDPILGFFHGWVAALAPHFEHIEVIALRVGKHQLPTNVVVHSLGKPASRLWYMARFGYLIWRRKHLYDSVFIHMNPEYILLAWPDWFVMRKPIYFWYNHPKADWRFKTAAWFATKVFYTSPYSAPAKLQKAVRMPAGIDTDVFKPQPVARNRHALYMQGRIMPSKRVGVALSTLRTVREKIADVTLTLVGPEEKAYGKKLREEYADVMSAVTFAGPIPNAQTPAEYSSHGLSINLAADGHYDKSVLESAACGTPPLFASNAFADLSLWPTQVRPDASGVSYVIGLDETAYEALGTHIRARVIERESLLALVKELTKQMA